MIVAGTTATFGYIIDWALRGSRDGGELIEVNPEETPLSRFATRLVREPAAIALPRIVDEILDRLLVNRVVAKGPVWPCARNPFGMQTAPQADGYRNASLTTDPTQVAFGGSRNRCFCICEDIRLPPAAINLLE